MDLQLDQIENALSIADGLPRVDWDVVEAWLARRYVRTDRRTEARLECVLQWLELLADVFGDDYWINSGRRCVLLTNQTEAAGNDLLRFAEAAVEQIGRLLDVAPEAPRAPKHILIRLHRMDLYYTYISHFYCDGEYGGSGGLYLSAGMPHIAFPRSPHGVDETIITHELTHAVMNAFDTPAWVEEGVAQIIQQTLTSVPSARLDHELAGSLRSYWQKHNLADFWSGLSFENADDGQGHSYRLAEILVRLLLADHRPRFLAFLRAATRGDGGAAAAEAVFGQSLPGIAGQFLGTSAAT